MIDSLKPYSRMKDSGIEWLGEVPEHWEIKRLRSSVNSCINGIWGSDPSGHHDLVCVRVADFDRVRLRVNMERPTMRAIVPKERRERMLRKGDLLLEKSGGGDLQPVGAVVMYDHEVPAVCSNFVARIPTTQYFNPSYLTYLHSCLYARRLNVRSIKQTTGIQNLDLHSYLSERVVFSPLHEQTAIVRFLDHADRRIRCYIRAKERLIALLEEQKKVIIHEAVTGRIDVRTGKPYPVYKDSDVEWLGAVPEHWGVRRLKAMAGNIIVQTNARTGSEIYLALEHVESWTGKYKEASPDLDFESQVKSFSCGDVLFGKLRPYLAKVVHARHDGVCVGEFFVLRCFTPNLSSNYLARLLCSKSVINIVNASTYGAKMPRANWHFMGNIFLPLPPRSAQTDIAAFLDQKVADIDVAVARTRRQIDLLREYRIRLIADVVTGKVDVCEAAVQLPEVDPITD